MGCVLGSPISAQIAGPPMRPPVTAYHRIFLLSVACDNSPFFYNSTDKCQARMPSSDCWYLGVWHAYYDTHPLTLTIPFVNSNLQDIISIEHNKYSKRDLVPLCFSSCPARLFVVDIGHNPCRDNHAHTPWWQFFAAAPKSSSVMCTALFLLWS